MADTTDIFGNINPCKEWYEDYNQYRHYPLWAEGAPGYDESLGQPQPSLAFFPAENAKGKGCVLIMAGGGYTHKAAHEGSAVAKRLNEGGINAAVLDYRLIPYEKPYILQDALRAVRYLKYHAQEFGIDPEHIAVLGFSAGGNLAAMTGFYGDDGDSSSPDPVERMSSKTHAAVICYAAIHFLKEEPEEDEGFYYDFYFKPSMGFPPAFVWQSFEDRLIHYSASVNLVDKLRSIDVPVEFHMFPYGGHGQGLATSTKEHDDNELTQVWSDLCIRWLHFYGF